MDRRQRIQTVAKGMWQPIPHPYPKRPKASKTWRKLKPGDKLSNIETAWVGGQKIPPASEWAVTGVNSLGAWLGHISGVSLYITDPEWHTQWAKLRKLRKKKELTT